MRVTRLDIEGLSLQDLKSLPKEEVDSLLAFGRPITFRIGSANVLAEFNRLGDTLEVNLAHIDGGGEGVLVVLWKAVEAYAAEREFSAIQWNVYALTCAHPNPRLQRFLRAKGFAETEHPARGWIFALTQPV